LRGSKGVDYEWRDQIRGCGSFNNGDQSGRWLLMGKWDRVGCGVQ
jgi:hypothetical protein